MLALLIAGGVIYLVLGDLGEAVIQVVMALFSVVITVAQETRTERALEALHDLTSPRALAASASGFRAGSGGRRPVPAVRSVALGRASENSQPRPPS